MEGWTWNMFVNERSPNSGDIFHHKLLPYLSYKQRYEFRFVSKWFCNQFPSIWCLEFKHDVYYGEVQTDNVLE